MQLLPHPGLVPLGHPTPTRRTRGAEQGGRQPVPAESGARRVQDALQGILVVGTPAAGMAEAPRAHRDQWLQPSPQLVSQDLLTHTAIFERRAPRARPARQLILN